MTSKERVRIAMGRGVPDRIPGHEDLSCIKIGFGSKGFHEKEGCVSI